MRFTKSYNNFTLHQDDRINITEVYAKGDTFSEMLANCEVYAEDWHGNPVSIDFESLRDSDAAVIRADMAHYVHTLSEDESLTNDGVLAIQYREDE